VRWLLVIFVACAAPAPPPPTLTKPPVVAPPPPAPITCADVAVILRGKVLDERDAGPMKEEAIAKACLHDKWSAEVIDCAGSSTTALACLDKLDEKQRTAYRVRIARWNDAFPEESLDEESPEDAPVDHIACADALGDVSQYPPALALKGGDRELAIAMRRGQLLVQCSAWPYEVRQCFRANKLPERCNALLDPRHQQALAVALAEIDALFAKMAAQKPAAFTCKKVVEAHYGDARWKGILDGMKPAERKKIIAKSRALMLKVCADDVWSPSLRSCVVADGGGRCFEAAGITALTWAWPPSAIPVRTGIAECDAYGDTLRALTRCAQIPKSAVQQMLDNFQASAPGLANMTAAQRTAAGQSCAQSDSSIRQSARSLGCTI
jgi:hypothetical protein